MKKLLFILLLLNAIGLKSISAQNNIITEADVLKIVKEGVITLINIEKNTVINILFDVKEDFFIKLDDDSNSFAEDINESVEVFSSLKMESWMYKPKTWLDDDKSVVKTSIQITFLGLHQ